MRVIYMGHSGFMTEMEHTILLFDYYTGTLPKLDPEKDIFVFVSHWHQDHYNHEIWNWRNQYPKIRYIISRDIPFSENVRKRLGLSEEEASLVHRVRSDQTYEFTGPHGQTLKVETLRSTDEGVAFYINCEGRTIYHAGDLNLWVWKEEDEAYNKNMQYRFEKEIKKLRGRQVDVAFLPLDPRQEEDAYGGMDAYRDAMEMKYIFPMHFWGDYDLISLYRNARKGTPMISAVQKIAWEGQEFSLA